MVASDGYCEWYGQHYLMDRKGLYHLCSGDRTKCKVKLPRGDGRELVHISRWRLVNPLMMHDMEYSKKRALEGIMSFIDAWSPRVPEPAGAPGVKRKVESFEDPTGIDKALEKAKKAATEKKEAHGESGRGPKGSVGARLERRAAERREQQRKKEEEKKKESRGRSRSRKRRRGRKEKRPSSSERRSESGHRSEKSQRTHHPRDRHRPSDHERAAGARRPG